MSDRPLETTPDRDSGRRRAESAPGSASDFGGEIRVLYVDSPDVARSVAEVLEEKREAFDVTVETGVGAALQRLDDRPVDCVVSDYGMDEMDGLEFLEAVRSKHPDLPFVLFTGAGSETVASDAISAGVSDYVQKGREERYTLLANRIENLVEQYRATREAERTHRRFRKLTERSSDVITVADAEGIFEYVSPSVREVFGYDPEALVGTSGFEYVHPDDRPGVEAAFDSLNDPSRDTATAEFRFRNADGDWQWVEARARDLRDDPDVGGVLVHHRDVTELRERDRRFEALVEQSTDVIAVLEESGEVQYVSSSIERVLGYDPGQPVEAKAIEYVHLEDRSRVLEWFEGVVDDDYERTETVDVRLRDVDGEWRWFQARSSTSPAEQLGGYVVSASEITEQRERERELERYRQVVEAAGDAMYATDHEGEVLMINRSFTELSGIEEDELVGEHASKFMTEEDFQRGTDVVLSILEDDEKQRGRFEFSSGYYPRDDRTFEAIVTVITDDDGEYQGTVGVIRDVTERKAREEQLERQNERLQTIVENVPIVLFAFDSEGEFTLSKGKGLENLGLDPGESVGENVLELYEGIPEIADPARTALDGERAHETAEIEGRFFETWYEPFLDGDGDVERVVGVSFDVTDRVEYQRKLERQNERLDQFASLVSHDLRNPLEVANAGVALARHGDEDALDDIQDAVDRMEAIIEDLLALAREGDAAENVEPVDLRSAVRTCWESVATPDAELRIEDPPTVEADRSKLRTLLENLLRNSVEHSSTGSRPGADDSVEHGSTGSDDERVTVRVGSTGDGFFVADDGPGIPEDEREQVFEPGYSGDGDGSGFGLYIVGTVADAHGWEVSVTESGDGGARFEVV